jgi:Holliday junction resolvase RusA-like endonuclease
MTITIPGKPIAKKRPRFSRRGKHVVTYSDQVAETNMVKLMIKGQVKECFEGAVKFYAIFFMPIPKSTSKKKRELMRSSLIHHTKKPDIDNLEKFVLDCCNGIVWCDDSQIIQSLTGKRYSSNPRTEITITEV